VVQKNAPTLADYNYDPVQSILIIFNKLFVNDHKSCLVVNFPPHRTYVTTVVYLVKHNALFCTNYMLIARNAPTSDHHITSVSVKEF